MQFEESIVTRIIKATTSTKLDPTLQGDFRNILHPDVDGRSALEEMTSFYAHGEGGITGTGVVDLKLGDSPTIYSINTDYETLLGYVEDDRITFIEKKVEKQLIS